MQNWTTEKRTTPNITASGAGLNGGTFTAMGEKSYYQSSDNATWTQNVILEADAEL